MNFDFATQVPYWICAILCFIPAIVFHEVMHGYAAYKLGDPTAKRSGRLSLNPLHHIDPFGTVIMPLILMIMGGPVFGYAKPVPYNPAYFKDPRKGDLIVGLAGPCANLLMALVGTGIAALLWFTVPQPLIDAYMTRDFLYYVYWMFLPMFVQFNLFLMFFNLLPIPPLDGSSIFAFILPRKYLPKYYRIQQYAMPIFLIVVIGLPYILHFNPLAIYLDWTAGNVFNLLYSFM